MRVEPVMGPAAQESAPPHLLSVRGRRDKHGLLSEQFSPEPGSTLNSHIRLPDCKQETSVVCKLPGLPCSVRAALMA